MALSKHNIITPITDSEDYFIVNPLSQSADIISANEWKMLKNKIDPKGEFMQRGYLIDETKERSKFNLAYVDFQDNREKEEIQLFFVPNYTCNFACTYCFQEGYNPVQKELTTEVIDAFFTYIQKEFSQRRKYLTIFGGEPLLSSPKQRELIAYFIEKSNEQGLEVAIVTNGYTLHSYLDTLKKAHIREIQVTLDGTQQVHDARRFLKGGETTFHRIVEGIDACLENKIPVNLRMVIDKENISNLVELAHYAIEKGWTQSPFFKTQIGRNYELHFCNSTPDKLFDRATLYQSMFALIKQHPHIAEFYKPSYSIAKYIAEHQEVPAPLFDSCPACKTEWAFDFTGTIYSCTATVGNKGDELGTFYPTIQKNESAINSWQNRDITTITECRDCSVALACGGGCASVAKNKNGHPNTPDCRPIKELLSLGAAAYFRSSVD